MVDFSKSKSSLHSKKKYFDKEKRNILIIGLCFIAFLYSLHATGWISKYSIKYAFNNYSFVQDYGIKMPKHMEIHGFDISAHQGRINWDKLTNFNSTLELKLDFVFIKATEGRTRVDKQFKNNWQRAQESGFIRGAYHYFLPNKSGSDQAELFLKTVSFKKGDFVPVCDIEITGGANKAKLVENLSDFLEILENKFSKKPIIYSSKKFYEKYLQDDFSEYPIWIAHYDVPELDLSEKWDFWQHSSKGKLKGCKLPVDFNVFNSNLDELDKLRIF